MLHPKNISKEEKAERFAWGEKLLSEVEKLLQGKGKIELRGSTLNLEIGSGKKRSWTVVDLNYDKRKVTVRNHEDQKKVLPADPKKIATWMIGMHDLQFVHSGGKEASSDLRSQTIRLAHANPALRPHLLPLVKR